MAPLASADGRTSPVSHTDLRAAGFTEAQALAIAMLTHATANEAMDLLRIEFARWHAYLALYVVSQVAIVVLALLLAQPKRERFETRVGLYEQNDTVAELIREADLIIAHSAGFDRRFCERPCPRFIHISWACSRTQLSWRAEEIEGTKLFYLANQQAFWFCGHRALDDFYALLELLEMPLPVNHCFTMGVLLDASQRPTAKIWALNAPFEVKGRLRERGCRWNVGDDGKPQAWHMEVHPDRVEAEIAFLDGIGFPDQIEPLVTEVDALIRFSDRLF